MRSEVSELLRDGAIVAMDNKPEYVSAIKCVAKKEPGKLRLVIDLSHLNKHVNTHKFQYDSFAKVADTIQTGDQFTSFDLKNGFYHCPLSDQASRYFGFCFEQKYYC